MKELLKFKIGEAICDMHYGGVRDFCLPPRIADGFRVKSAISFTVGNECEFYRHIEDLVKTHPYAERPHYSYCNKLLVVIDIKIHSGTLVCAYSYDSRVGGIVELEPIYAK